MIREISNRDIMPEPAQGETDDGGLFDPIMERGKEQKFFAGFGIINKGARLLYSNW